MQVFDALDGFVCAVIERFQASFESNQITVVDDAVHGVYLGQHNSITAKSQSASPTLSIVAIRLKSTSTDCPKLFACDNEVRIQE